VLVLVPTSDDEDFLEQIMRDANRAAKEIGVSIIGGHTGYTSGLSRPLVAVTALGSASGRKLVRTSGAQIGDHVLVTKGIALEGTAILAQDFNDVALKLGLSKRDIEKALHLMGEVSVVPEALVFAGLGCFYPMWAKFQMAPVCISWAKKKPNTTVTFGAKKTNWPVCGPSTPGTGSHKIAVVSGKQTSRREKWRINSAYL
jgi:hypothetical protein